MSCDEYLYACRKQAGTSAPADFLDRFIRLKWKVCCALTCGLDTTEAFRSRYEACRKQLQAESRQLSASERGGVPVRQGEWVAHVCVRVSQNVSHAGINRFRAQMDSLVAEVGQGEGLKQWIEEHGDSLPAGWQAEVTCVSPCRLPNDLLERFRRLQPGEVAGPFLSAVGLHVLGRLDGSVAACEPSPSPADDKTRLFMLQEYYDGLLAGLLEDSLFRVDEHQLSRYYKKHKKHYRWDLPHFKGLVLQAGDEEKLNRLLKYLKGFPQDKWEEAIDNFDRIGGSRWLKAEYGLFRIGKNACVDKLYFGQGSFTPSADFPYVRVLGKKLKRKPESYKDVYEQVKQDYRASVLQKEEAKWKKIFKVEINEEVLKTVNNHDAI